MPSKTSPTSSASALLQVRRLAVTVADRSVVGPLDLNLKAGAIHALMGPNGSGKSSLAYALMGHPDYHVTAGTTTLNGDSLLDKSPDERAHLGLFLAFQHPVAIPGVSVQNALKTAYEAIHCTGCHLHDHCPKLSVTEFRQQLQHHAQILAIHPSFMTRALHDGFSGGEKKRLEMLTLLTLKPKIAILDETDSGLDIDALKLVAHAAKLAARQDQVGLLVITHYPRLLQHLRPTQVSVMVKGQIVATDGPKLISRLDQSGYRQFL
ncbi:Fe-S cluster assembly ATPase SufC [Microgenomates group bacterium RBG_16_45_19]|nr:MAG: Fe-S cluster assembly ATPase SufC [Microgenomates group bacterium RBG_16_45_19]